MGCFYGFIKMTLPGQVSDIAFLRQACACRTQGCYACREADFSNFQEPENFMARQNPSACLNCPTWTENCFAGERPGVADAVKAGDLCDLEMFGRDEMPGLMPRGAKFGLRLRVQNGGLGLRFAPHNSLLSPLRQPVKPF